MDYTKLDKRIDYMLSYEDDDFISNMNIHKNISDKLYDYQLFHVFNLLSSLRSFDVVLDGSDTGTGKTYTTCAICKHLDKRPYIFAPLTMHAFWLSVCKIFNVQPICIVNYEATKSMFKQYDNPYYTINTQTNTIIWKLPPNSIFVFDEVHKCKNKSTLNGQLLLSTKNTRIKTILLSATIADSVKTFNIFGYMLGLYKTLRGGSNWINGIIYDSKNKMGSIAPLLYESLFPDRGSKMSIKQIKNKFPDNQISADCYVIDDIYINEVNSIFDSHQLSLGNLKMANSDNNNLFISKIIANRARLEFIKLTIIKSLIDEYLENNFSVAVFLNFNTSIDELANHFKTNCIIRGGQSPQQRQINIDKFQNNKSFIIICNIKSGSEGISLHDLYGRPRISIISPSFSSTELKQTLGRIHRVGSLSPAIQRIIFCAGTCEEIICNTINNKLKFSSIINDDDLFSLI